MNVQTDKPRQGCTAVAAATDGSIGGPGPQRRERAAACTTGAAEAEETETRPQRLKRLSDRIIGHACKVGKVSRKELLSNSRRYPLTVLRYICFDNLYYCWYFSTPEIGRIFNRNHATVLMGLKSLAAWLEIRDKDVISLHRAIYELLAKD